MQVHKALITPFIHPFNKSKKSLRARRWVICQLHIGEESRPSEPALPMFTLSKPRGRGPQTGPSRPPSSRNSACWRDKTGTPTAGWGVKAIGPQHVVAGTPEFKPLQPLSLNSSICKMEQSPLL